MRFEKKSPFLRVCSFFPDNILGCYDETTTLSYTVAAAVRVATLFDPCVYVFRWRRHGRPFPNWKQWRQSYDASWTGNTARRVATSLVQNVSSDFPG